MDAGHVSPPPPHTHPHQVAPVIEALTASCRRYDDLLGRDLLRGLGDALASDSLEAVEARAIGFHGLTGVPESCVGR